MFSETLDSLRKNHMESSSIIRGELPIVKLREISPLLKAGLG